MNSNYEFMEIEYNAICDLRNKKLDMLQKLSELAQRGIKISQNYNINSSYEEMNMEYNIHTKILERESIEKTKKVDILRKLGKLAQHGIGISQNYSMHSNYDEMEFEYNMHMSTKILENDY